MQQHWKITAILLCLIAASLVVTTQTGSLAPLAFCTAATGIISFFYFANTRSDATAEAKEARLRRAIASAIVLQYLLMVGIANFLINSPKDLSGLTQTLLSNFTTIVGVVIASYFGASAYVESRKASPSAPESKKESA